MPRRKKSLKYSAEAAKTMSITGVRDKAATVSSMNRRCLLRVSIRDGIIESRLEELWARQGCIQVEDTAPAKEVS